MNSKQIQEVIIAIAVFATVFFALKYFEMKHKPNVPKIDLDFTVSSGWDEITFRAVSNAVVVIPDGYYKVQRNKTQSFKNTYENKTTTTN